MLICGPCLLNDNQAEIDNVLETARQLHAIDPEIMFRCKLWGGGTCAERYRRGICFGGIDVFSNLKLKSGIEIKDTDNLVWLFNYPESTGIEFVWVAARAMQNYTLLEKLGRFKGRIFIKRNPGATIDELIGIHDICRDIHGYNPIMIERGINTFCRTDKRRWMPDFQGMLRMLTERPDIELMFDPSHACGCKEDISPMIKAACALGVKHFMLEVYANPELTQTDKAQALSVEEFKPMYEYIKRHEA